MLHPLMLTRVVWLNHGAADYPRRFYSPRGFASSIKKGRTDCFQMMSHIKDVQGWRICFKIIHLCEIWLLLEDEGICLYKTLNFYQITWHHISKDGNLSLHILCVTWVVLNLKMSNVNSHNTVQQSWCLWSLWTDKTVMNIRNHFL